MYYTYAKLSFVSKLLFRGVGWKAFEAAIIVVDARSLGLASGQAGLDLMAGERASQPAKATLPKRCSKILMHARPSLGLRDTFLNSV
jgi:hypothetical protein